MIAWSVGSCAGISSCRKRGLSSYYVEVASICMQQLPVYPVTSSQILSGAPVTFNRP